jgi:hypothetical protein
MLALTANHQNLGSVWKIKHRAMQLLDQDIADRITFGGTEQAQVNYGSGRLFRDLNLELIQACKQPGGRNKLDVGSSVQYDSP